MPVRLDRSSADFDQRFAAFLAAKREVSADVERATRAIVDDVAARGDAALIEATRKFDRLDLDAKGLRVTAAEIDAAVQACDAKTVEALSFARDRIETFHRRQLPKDERFTDALGVELGWRWSAVDLLAQAEHDASAQSILITDNAKLAADIERAVEAQLATLPRAEIARASWNEFGAVIMVKNLDQAAELANAIAAEHLEIMTADAEALAATIRNAGAVFLGAHTPEAIGDYVGGSNHVLPTARSARFSSGLGVLDFMKRTSILKCGPDQLRALGPAAITLGQSEGLEGHARSVAIRLNLK